MRYILEFCALASGSSGNCIYVSHMDTAILVDAGISGKKIEESLASIGVRPESISAILITHEHCDHIGGAAVFARRFNTPLYGTERTLKFLSDNARCKPANTLMHVIGPDRDFELGTLHISPFRISHDALDPVSYCISADGRKLGMATDLGVYDDYTVERLKNSDALYIEANHDESMLMLGPYPYKTKLRINSELGHLSNEACGRLVNEVRSEKLHDVVLAHISKDNNFEELAYETVRLALESDKGYSTMPTVRVARRHEPTGLIKV